MGIKKEDSKRSKTNDEIQATTVRLIGADGAQAGIVPIAEALKAAADAKVNQASEVMDEKMGELSEAAKKKIEEKAGIDVDAELEKLKNASEQAKGAATKAAEVASTAQEQLEAASDIAAEKLVSFKSSLINVRENIQKTPQNIKLN